MRVSPSFGLRPETVQHAMNCFARFVRLLLGTSAIADRKVECGASLVVLGVQVDLGHSGFRMRPAREKAAKCVAAVQQALASGVLNAGGCRCYHGSANCPWHSAHPCTQAVQRSWPGGSVGPHSFSSTAWAVPCYDRCSINAARGMVCEVACIACGLVPSPP